MLSVLPAQNANDEALIKRGIQEGPAFVAADRSAGWLIFNCESQDKAQELLQTAPVYKYCDYDITPLLATEENTPG
jgi:muconolactone delta-isomerase